MNDFVKNYDKADDAINAGWRLLAANSEEKAAMIGCAVQSAYGPWENPVPLDEWYTPEWPKGLMPEELERFTDAVAEANQTPPAQSKSMTLPILASALGGQYELDISGRRENLAFFAAVAAKSGERKSADLRVLRTPLDQFESQSSKLFQEQEEQESGRRELLEAQLLELKKKAARPGAKCEELLAYQECRNELGRRSPKVPPRLLTDDITPEKLAEQLWKQGGSLCLLAAEGNILEDVTGRYKKTSRLEAIYLKGFSGEPICYERKNSGSLKVDRPCLSMGAMTQPSHLRGLLGDKLLKGRGLLERFLWVIPMSRIGSRRQGIPISGFLTAAYQLTMQRLLPQQSCRVPGQVQRRRRLRFDAVGLDQGEGFARRIEPRMAEGKDLSEISGWASRLPTMAYKIAALWFLYDCAAKDHQPSEVIPGEWVSSAVRLVSDFVIPMGQKTFGMMGAEPGHQYARRILKVIQRESLQKFTKSEMKQVHFKNVKANQLNPAYSTLLERNYLRELKVRGDGRPATMYYVNPLSFEPALGTEGLPTHNTLPAADVPHWNPPAENPFNQWLPQG